MTIFFFGIILIIINKINSSLRTLPLSSLQHKSSFIHKEFKTAISKDSYFLLPISIGTPPQFFNVIIATATDFSFIIDKQCQKNNINKFDSTISNTTSNLNEIQFLNYYGAGSGYGFILEDNITFEKFNKSIRIPFVSVLNENKLLTNGDGVISFAHKFQNETQNIIDKLRTENIINKKVFSLYFPLNNVCIFSPLNLNLLYIRY